MYPCTKTEVCRKRHSKLTEPKQDILPHSVIFILIYFLVLVLVFELLFSFSFVYFAVFFYFNFSFASYFFGFSFVPVLVIFVNML